MPNSIFAREGASSLLSSPCSCGCPVDEEMTPQWGRYSADSFSVAISKRLKKKNKKKGVNTLKNMGGARSRGVASQSGWSRRQAGMGQQWTQELFNCDLQQ